MEIYQSIKNIIEKNKSKIQLIQWAIASGISTLLYSEYLRRMQQKITPKRLILIPTIKSVEEFLNMENNFMKWMSNNLVNNMINNKLFIKYIGAPEFIVFTDEYIDIIKTIFDLHILPNISRVLPDIIKTKFNLDSDQKFFIESSSIDLFERKDIKDKQFDFLVEEIILQLLLLIPTMKKNILIPEDNKTIFMKRDMILTIGNEKAICGIHFNDNIINNYEVMELLEFVTSTSVEHLERKKDNDYFYLVKTNPFNTVGLLTLEGIEISEGG